MIRNTVFIVALICFGLGQSAYGQTDSEKKRCDESIVNLVGKHLDVSDFSYPKDRMYPSAENGGVIIAGVCKVWPKDSSKTIAIFAYDAGVEYEKRLIVVLVDTRKWRIVASYKGVIQEDAAMTVGDDSFRIDTARYDIAPGVRAFGLDITNSYSQGCGDGGSGPVRTLFVQDGKEIKPILEDFYISSWSYIQEGQSRCTGTDAPEESLYENRGYSLSVDTTSTNGYRDLLVTETISRDDGKKTGEPLRYKLHYDGKKYLK
jgi:hypothetical protein